MKGFTLIAITLIILTINLIMLLQTLMLKMLFNLNTTTLTNYKIWKYLTKINHWLISYNLKAYSLKINFDDLHLLSSINKNFAVIAMTETRITKNVSLTNNLTMSNFSFELTPTESSAGGTLLYIANHSSYKPRLDLNIYKSTGLESSFIEIFKCKKSNIITDYN